MINGIDKINWEFEPVLLPPRGCHRGYYERELIKDCDQRFYLFNKRTAQNWNYMTQKNVTASSTKGFKKNLDVYIKKESNIRYSSPSTDAELCRSDSIAATHLIRLIVLHGLVDF